MLFFIAPEIHFIIFRSIDDLDSECNSAPWTPTSGITIEHAIHNLQHDYDGREGITEPKKTYSREECLHESAATGGPNVAMRIRYFSNFQLFPYLLTTFLFLGIKIGFASAV